MKRWWRFLALAMALVLINAVTQVVMERNAAAGAYPPDGDSIAIPIYGTLLLSLIASPWLLLIAFFSRIRTVRAYFLSGGIGSALVTTGIVALYLPAILLALGGIEYWAIPLHYEIAVAFGVSVFVLAVLAWDDFRTLRSNLALNTDARQDQPRAG
jgi:hypothetical protein